VPPGAAPFFSGGSSFSVLKLTMSIAGTSGSTMGSIPFAHALDIKLTGQNYREWAYSFKMLLLSTGLASHLTDSPPDATDKDAQA
jgi:hypothetical protein